MMNVIERHGRNGGSHETRPLEVCRMTPVQRARQALALTAIQLKAKRAEIRQIHPDWSAERVDLAAKKAMLRTRD